MSNKLFAILTACSVFVLYLSIGFGICVSAGISLVFLWAVTKLLKRGL